MALVEKKTRTKNSQQCWTQGAISGGISLQLNTSTQAPRTFVTGVTQTETILGEDIHLHLHHHHRCPGGRGHIKDEHQEVERVETII